MQHYHKQKGIVLTEAIIAVAVMSIIFTATLTTLRSSLGGVRTSTEQLIATYLAQDAVEALYARWQSNLNSTTYAWDDGLQCGAGATCNVDTTVPNASSIQLTSCTTCKLDIDAGTGKYTPDETGTSGFVRKITTSTTGLNSGEMQITVTVEWNTKPKGTYESTFTIYDESS